MKVLALIEINQNGRILSAEPEKVFIENCELAKVEMFFKNTEKLHKQSKTLSTVQLNTKLRLDANFNEIANMGFVHVSELDKFLEKKIIEVENRVRAGLYWKRLKLKVKKAGMWVIGKIGIQLYKESTKK